MSSTAFLPALQVAVPEGTTFGPALVALLTSGLVGMSIKNMFDSILSDEGEGEMGGSTGEEMADGGGLMAEDDGDDAFGDLGGLDGGDGEMDDFGGDEFGDMDDAAGAGTDELEHRMDELENEVGSLSSTVSTVRTENEQISESVQEVEENVRKLLDIYEMVTRGVNPFADDIEAGMGGGGGMAGESSFGLFDDGEEEEAEEDIDDDIANADAEGFFDEELVDDGDDEFGADDGDVDDVFGDDGDDDPFEDDGGTFDEEEFGDDDADDDGEGGKSFQELKDEYDSGDAEWAEGEEPVDDEDDFAADAEDDPTDDDLADDLADDDLFDDVVEDDGLDDAADEPADVGAELDPEPATEPEPEPASDEPETSPDSEPAAADGTESETAAASTTDEASATDGGKPYLAALPDGFAGDLIVVEWLEYLLQEAGHREAARAIDYYETIDWIDADVADELQEVLRGFDDVGGGEGGLTIDHHTRSLQYISELDDDGGAEAVALSQLVSGGGADGVQR